MRSTGFASGIISAAIVAVSLVFSVGAEPASKISMDYKSPAFAGKLPADWRIDRLDFRDFSIYQVLDGTITPDHDIEIFAVYDGSSIKDLNLTSSSISRCMGNGMAITFGRSEATAQQSGMSHLLIRTQEGRYLHAFSTMLDLSSPAHLQSWGVSLSFEGVPLSELPCSQ